MNLNNQLCGVKINCAKCEINSIWKAEIPKNWAFLFPPTPEGKGNPGRWSKGHVVDEICGDQLLIGEGENALHVGLRGLKQPPAPKKQISKDSPKSFLQVLDLLRFYLHSKKGRYLRHIQYTFSSSQQFFYTVASPSWTRHQSPRWRCPSPQWRSSQRRRHQELAHLGSHAPHSQKSEHIRPPSGRRSVSGCFSSLFARPGNGRPCRSTCPWW